MKIKLSYLSSGWPWGSPQGNPVRLYVYDEVKIARQVNASPRLPGAWKRGAESECNSGKSVAKLGTKEETSDNEAASAELREPKR